MRPGDITYIPLDRIPDHPIPRIIPESAEHPNIASRIPILINIAAQYFANTLEDVVSQEEKNVYIVSLFKEISRVVDLPLHLETGQNKRYPYPTQFRLGVGKDLTAEAALKLAAKQAGKQTRRNFGAFIPPIQWTHIVIDLLEEAVFEETTNKKDGTITTTQIYPTIQ